MSHATVAQPTNTVVQPAATPTYAPVDRRNGLTLREFKREYFRRKPVVVSGGPDQWKAWSSWTWDNFKRRCGTSTVTIYPFQGESYRQDAAKKVSLAEYIDNILVNDFDSYPYYMIYNFSLLQEHKDLWQDFAQPSYCFDWFSFLPKAVRFPSPRLYIGPKGTISTLHQDRWGTHFWMAQFQGRKHWILFPPEEEKYLYPVSSQRGNGLVRYRVQPDAPALEQFPLFEKCHGMECVIGPGDLLIVPGDWLHWVKSLDPTFSLSHNYMTPGNITSSMLGLTKWFVDLQLKKTRKS
jgi:ribosomal protein L16 Arg81 hydroxylase